jgi:hypothetical protein
LLRVLKMMKKLLLSLATVALAVAGAATHTVRIFDPVYLNGHELKPGDYKLELKDGTAVLRSGKDTIESPVKVENGDSKFGTTTVRYSTVAGKPTVEEIRLRGTNTKLVFNPEVSQAR